MGDKFIWKCICRIILLVFSVCFCLLSAGGIALQKKKFRFRLTNSPDKEISYSILVILNAAQYPVTQHPVIQHYLLSFSVDPLLMVNVYSIAADTHSLVDLCIPPYRTDSSISKQSMSNKCFLIVPTMTGIIVKWRHLHSSLWPPSNL